ncbi:MAG: hypothetical protein ACE5J4_03505 [Candidatus Aenigmatarchaeota archaeon]
MNNYLIERYEELQKRLSKLIEYSEAFSHFSIFSFGFNNFIYREINSLRSEIEEIRKML